MKHNKQAGMIVALGVTGGMVALGTAAVMIWNSRQMRMMRMMNRTKHIMSKVGNTLCKISEADCM